MSKIQHYQEAERLLMEANKRAGKVPLTDYLALLQLAQMHATLATVRDLSDGSSGE